jgi:hypothetical protein
VALNIGELVGYLDLDAGPFEKGIGKAFDSMGSKKWQVAGAAAGVAAGTAILSGMMSSMETEKLNNKMAASLGLTKTQAATAGKAAGQLYADNYGSSMEDVTGATESVMSSIKGMRTASQADIQAVTKDVLNLSSAFEIDAGRAAQVAGQMITSGIATDATNAADLLAGTLSKVPKNVREDIMDAVDEYGPFMNTLGMKGEEAMGILANASKKGMYGIDKTGDALKEFTIRATDMSTASKVGYDSLGMSQEKMSAKLLAGGDSAKQAFNDIIQGLSSMKDPVKQSQAALALFGTPLEDLSVTEIPNFLNAIDPMGDKFDSLKGKAGELDTTLGAGASNGWTKFQRAGETSLAAIGAQVLPVLTPIVEKMTEWAPVLGPLVIALGAFAAIMWVVNAAMAANPITWIILGIMLLIAAIVLLVMNWSTVVDFLTVVWGGFVNWIKSVMDGFLVWWGTVWDGFLGFLSDTWNNAGKGISDFVGSIGTFFAEIPGNVQKALADAGTWLFDAGKNIVQGLFDGIKSLAGTIGNFFLSLLPGWIVEPFKLALDIHSPSRVFRKLGRQIPAGLMLGVEDGQPAIDGTMAGLVNLPPVPAVSAPAYGVRTGGIAPGATGSAPASSGFVQNNYINEASNTDEIVQKVWTKFQYKMREGGVRV